MEDKYQTEGSEKDRKSRTRHSSILNRINEMNGVVNSDRLQRSNGLKNGVNVTQSTTSEHGTLRGSKSETSNTKESTSPFLTSLRKNLIEAQTSKPTRTRRENNSPSALINGLKARSKTAQTIDRGQLASNTITRTETPNSKSSTRQVTSRNPNTNASAFLNSGRPHVISGLESGIGPRGGFHVISGRDGDYLPVRGSIFEHVESLNLHLHGLIIRTGTTASGADRNPETDATGRVFGLIPESIGFLRKMALNAYELNSGSKTPNLDSDGRPYQFGVVNVLGREDHAKVIRSLQMARDKSDSLHSVIERAGAPAGTRISSILYNDAGQPFAFGVKFPDSQFIRMTNNGPESAQHIVFIHSTKSIGGGKSDEKLADGELPFECRMLAQEFEWWKAALSVTGGKIGGIDSTIGGTARTARYAMLVAGLQPQMFAVGAIESIGVDRGDWVENYLSSEKQEYRANLATSILRSAYGEASKRLRGIDIELIDRQDFESRLAREIRSTTALLRTLFMGHPDLIPLKGDISDEIWSRNREQRITEHEWSSIVDNVEQKKWKMSRRTELMTAQNLSFSDIERMASGEGGGILREKVENMMVDMRYLITENPYLVSNGGFVTLTFYVPQDRPKNRLTNNLISRSMELFASAITSAGAPKVLTRILPSPRRFINGKSILMMLSEEHAGTNLLMASNSDSDTHVRRTIIQNHKIDEEQTRSPRRKSAYSFRVILDGIIKAHQLSRLSSCVKDAELIRAYYRYVYGGEYGLSKVSVGGSNRPVEKLHYREEYQ